MEFGLFHRPQGPGYQIDQNVNISHKNLSKVTIIITN